MKKILLFVIALCTLLVSCNQKTLPSEQPKHSKSATQAATRITNIHAEYMSLEDAIRGASDIVKAKCVNKIDNPTCIEYEFSVTERFAGDQTSENIFVKIQKNEIIYIFDGSNIVNKVISDAPGCTSYETGLEYYLLLTKWVSVYYDHDEYLLPINSPFIPASDITKSTVYGEPIEKHSEIKLPTSEEELCDYIKDIVSKREPPIGANMNVHEYIRETDMPTVIRKSKTIAKIKVLKQKYAGNANINQNIYTCKVVEPLKGEVKADEDVDIIFFPGTVAIGSEYVVALDEGILLDATMSYRLSSKNSLFPISEESNIKNLINNN